MGCYGDTASYVLVDMIYSTVIIKSLKADCKILNLVSMCADICALGYSVCLQVVWLYRLNCCLKDQRHCLRFTVAYEVQYL